MKSNEFKRLFPYPIIEERNDRDVTIDMVFNDSRRVKPGAVFCAIAGEKFDGHQFIAQAIEAGAAMIIHERPLSHRASDVVHWRVEDGYSAYAAACEIIAGNPAATLKLIGITGTNGKTSSAFLIKHILERSGKTAGLISTVRYDDGDESRPAARTTPEPGELQTLFAAMRRNQLEFAVMEVSSHALAQRRPGTAKFNVTLFTNLSGDHLDYHGDMESYFASKKRLFTEYLGEDGTAVVNVDDPHGERLAKTMPDGVALPFGLTAANGGCRIVDFETSVEGSRIQLMFKGARKTLETNLIGKHNVLNVVGAVAATTAAGVQFEDAKAALRSPVRIPGRLEAFHTDDGAAVFVDYAHTDDALRNALSTLSELKTSASQRLNVLFGCGGDRDRTKRPRMGAVAAELADAVVVTSDNPRAEDPAAIIAEIKTGIPAEADVVTIPDRREAIRETVGALKSGDILLIAGKGHETYQEINGEFHDFDDREEVRKVIAIRQNAERS